MIQLNKVLIIGSGSIGQRHAGNIKSLIPDIEFMFLKRTETPCELIRELGAKVVSDMYQAINWGPDFAIISSPSSYHYADLLSLISSKIPFYIEKPVVTSRLHLEELSIIDIESLPVTMSGCNLRFLPVVVKLRQLLDEKIIGNVVRATFEAGQWLPDWRPNQNYSTSYSASSVMGGGVILDLIHEVDIARFLFGEFSEIHAFAGKFSSLNIQSEDTACIILRPTSGKLLLSINIDYVSRKPKRKYEIVGDKGSIVLDITNNSIYLVTQSDEIILDNDSLSFDIPNTYITSMTEFLKAVSSGVKTSQDLSEGLLSAELAIKIKEAAGL